MLRLSECKELAHFAEREQLRAVLLRKDTTKKSKCFVLVGFCFVLACNFMNNKS